MIPDKNEENVLDDEEKELTIRELSLLIRIEEEKPEAERDEDLIDECIREIADLKGVRSSYSQEEVSEIITEIKKREEVRRARSRRVLRWLIPIAAVFALATTVAATATNSLHISDISKWFFSTLQPKTEYSEENVDLIITDDIKKYTTLEELAEAVGIPLLLPYDMEKDMQNTIIELSDYGEFQIVMITFEYQSSSCWLTIRYPNSVTYNNEEFEIEIRLDDIQTAEINGYIQAEWNIEQIIYQVKSDNYDTVDLIIQNMRLK